MDSHPGADDLDGPPRCSRKAGQRGTGGDIQLAAEAAAVVTWMEETPVLGLPSIPVISPRS